MIRATLLGWVLIGVSYVVVWLCGFVDRPLIEKWFFGRDGGC